MRRNCSSIVLSGENFYFPLEVTARYEIEDLMLCNAFNIRRLAEPPLVGFKAAMLVLFTAVTMAGVIPADAGNGLAHGRIPHRQIPLSFFTNNVHHQAQALLPKGIWECSCGIALPAPGGFREL